MRIYLLSPKDVLPNPHLFPLWVNEWGRQGCEIVDNIIDANAVFIDLHSRIADYSDTDMGVLIGCTDKTLVTFDEFDKGGMSKLDWPEPLNQQQKTIFDHIEKNNINAVHFCRLLNKKNKYPSNVFPYEKPYFFDFGLLSENDIWDRLYDIVWVANTAPQREKLKNILEKDGRLKTKIILGAKKLPLQDWINAHRQGKMFISWSAGGFGDEKIQHLFSVAAIIKENNNQLFLHDFTHLENCIRPNPNPTKEDVDKIVEIVNNKETLYEIYKNGYDFVKKYYSKEYIASNILETIKKHL